MQYACLNCAKSTLKCIFKDLDKSFVHIYWNPNSWHDNLIHDSYYLPRVSCIQIKNDEQFVAHAFHKPSLLFRCLLCNFHWEEIVFFRHKLFESTLIVKHMHFTRENTIIVAKYMLILSSNNVLTRVFNYLHNIFTIKKGCFK